MKALPAVPLRAFWLALVIILGYMGARYFVYLRMPVLQEVEATAESLARAALVAERRMTDWREFYAGSLVPYDVEAEVRRDERYAATHEFSWDLWFVRDLWMSIPRLLFFLACLAVMAACGGLRVWGWHWGLSRESLGLLVLNGAGYVGQFIARGKSVAFTGGQAALGWLATLPVALCEEACFRGVVFLSLLGRLGPRKSAALSSLLFAVYHVQAQSVGEWPNIFLTGFILCAAAYRGAGLPWLILLHEAVDGLWYHFGSSGHLPMEHPLLGRAAFGLLLAAGVWAFIILKPKPGEAPGGSGD